MTLLNKSFNQEKSDEYLNDNNKSGNEIQFVNENENENEKEQKEGKQILFETPKSLKRNSNSLSPNEPQNKLIDTKESPKGNLSMYENDSIEDINNSLETEDTQSENENQEKNEKIKERRKQNRKKYKAKKKLNKSLENNELELEKKLINIWNYYIFVFIILDLCMMLIIF